VTATVAETALGADAKSLALPRVSKPGRVPIKSWVIDLEGWVIDLEGRALEQATNPSNLPFAFRHVALMPDAHAGYGMPIGGVLFAERAVVPYAIGVDIGCGVALVETDLTVEPLGTAGLKATLAQTARDVPVGMLARRLVSSGVPGMPGQHRERGRARRVKSRWKSPRQGREPLQRPRRQRARTPR
jgi:RNA-splicing ligase RtcB